MAYVPEIGGYIADVPALEFIRADGIPFAWDEVSTASITANSNSITINGGWSKFPLTVIDTDSTMELAFESAKFSPEIFSSANSTSVSVADSVIFETATFSVADGLVITIPHVVKVDKTIIKGFAYTASTLATGKFTAVAGASATTITFNTGDVAVGDAIRVYYYRIVSDAKAVVVNTDSNSATGELWVHYPIFSAASLGVSGTLLGMLHIHMYRVRVTTMPGFNSSYKTAGTNGLTFSAVDPKRVDKAFFSMKIESFVNGSAPASTETGTGSTDWTA
jgi:hypothetical protein